MSNGEYGYKFILDGTTDITDKVISFNIEAGLEMYCRELSFSISDEDMYDSFNFSIIPETPSVEVFTRTTVLGITDEYDEYEDLAWVSQGVFYIERPTFSVGVNETSLGIWGRQSTAILGEPFAQKITKLWEVDTTFYQICQEIVESVGLIWDSTRCDIQDFKVYADNFEADDQYPVEVLKSLVELAIGEEGFVTCDRLGYVCIKRLVRTPTVADFDITDLSVQTFSEDPEWPEFGNRIKIIPSETVSQDKVELFMDRECIGTGSGIAIDVYAQVSNGDGVPINNAVVTWSFMPLIPKSVWYKYSNNVEGLFKTALQNTTRILVSNELQKATGTNSVEVRFNVESVVGIWAYADKSRSTNFATTGYTIDGRNIFITGDGFDYCDQAVFISYYASGMAKNSILYGVLPAEEPVGVTDLLGSVTAVAEVSGRQSIKDIYVDNPCKCPTTLIVEVDESGPLPLPPLPTVFSITFGITSPGQWQPQSTDQTFTVYGTSNNEALIPVGSTFQWNLLESIDNSSGEFNSSKLYAPIVRALNNNGVGPQVLKMYAAQILAKEAIPEALTPAEEQFKVDFSFICGGARVLSIPPFTIISEASDGRSMVLRSSGIELGPRIFSGLYLSMNNVLWNYIPIALGLPYGIESRPGM